MPECGFGGGHEGPWGCCFRPDDSRFAQEVRYAIWSTGIEHVAEADAEAYRDAVVLALQKAGYCAVKGGPGDEIGVKHPGDDSYSEQYDIIRADGAAMVLHAASCAPARF